MWSQSGLLKTIVSVAVLGAATVYVYKTYINSESTTESGEATSSQGQSASPKAASASAKIDLKTASRDDVLNLLREIIKIQKEMSQSMQEVTKRIVEKNMSLDDAYDIVAQNQPEDPLEKHGLSVSDFDALLERFTPDREVHDAIMEVVQGPEQATGPEAKALTVERIVEINLTMLEKFKSAIAHYKEAKQRDPVKYNNRTMSIAAQAVVGAHVQREFNLTADEVEAAMMAHQLELSMRRDFLQASDEIQKILNECIHYQ
eukprot:Blabericola_migrator_1__569@NODE_1140_length_5303_cov_96_490451_g776_i0_p3_GENE_NODE_1140_length_5303_cov_96_490451_g776_i0NODE_1140_length_5303_cov_96_490451_g776_i0_p3_ORF_typecomplete_len260_score48_38RPA_C/PF08784_11/0_018RPA_C/PF08784_11/9_2e03RPA_C/PF08784_11/3_9e03HAUS2/PF15003_6/0_14HAUS2/PF15003_6/40TPR_11/PF13414_6/0_15DUF4168/PF13767_6/38DUF4168/PF13767_6/6_7DUF4168/PF13767_6/1_6e03CHASE6_C/PF17150_4/2_5e02CHASE6_C/PF17150_4/5_8TPR_21/PF09976_9/3_1e02_NODE_1140_length_5303_cov_96_4904